VTIVLGLVPDLIALVALLLTLRQIRLSNGGNHLPVILEAFKVAHAPDSPCLGAEKYLLNDLARQYPDDCSVTELSGPAYSHALFIGMFFDDLGKAVAHGMIHEDVVLGSFGPGVVPIWDALAPYVYRQREVSSSNFWIYFEDLAARATTRPSSDIYKALGLRSRQPRRGPHAPSPD